MISGSVTAALIICISIIVIGNVSAEAIASIVLENEREEVLVTYEATRKKISII